MWFLIFPYFFINHNFIFICGFLKFRESTNFNRSSFYFLIFPLFFNLFLTTTNFWGSTGSAKIFKIINHGEMNNHGNFSLYSFQPREKYSKNRTTGKFLWILKTTVPFFKSDLCKSAFGRANERMRPRASERETVRPTDTQTDHEFVLIKTKSSGRK